MATFKAFLRGVGSVAKEVLTIAAGTAIGTKVALRWTKRRHEGDSHANKRSNVVFVAAVLGLFFGLLVIGIGPSESLTDQGFQRLGNWLTSGQSLTNRELSGSSPTTWIDAIRPFYWWSWVVYAACSILYWGFARR